jgi:uncharacterized protein (TIGR02444 family)
MLQCDNPFWRFSLAVYAMPGVASECLALQDAQGVDVNVLLFCAWLGSAQRIVLTEANLATIESAVRPWRDAVILPMRAVRRDIKAMADAAQDDIAALRKDVAALELRAEQIEQARLYHLVSALDGAAATTAEIAIRHDISLLLGGQREAARLIEAALALCSGQIMPKLKE